MGDLTVIRKSLAAACGETREGVEADGIGGAVVARGCGRADADAGDGRPGGFAGSGSGRADADAGDGRPGAGGGGGVVPAFVVAPGSTDEAAGVMRVAA